MQNYTLASQGINGKKEENTNNTLTHDSVANEASAGVSHTDQNVRTNPLQEA